MIYGGKTGFSDLNDVVFEAHSALSTQLDKFDSIAASGMSGVTVAAPLAVLLNKPLVVVRKEADGSHNQHAVLVEGVLDVTGARVLWVDDFIATGDTRYWVEKNVKENSGRIVGQYMYSSSSKLEWY